MLVHTYTKAQLLTASGSFAQRHQTNKRVCHTHTSTFIHVFIGSCQCRPHVARRKHTSAAPAFFLVHSHCLIKEPVPFIIFFQVNGENLFQSFFVTLLGFCSGFSDIPAGFVVSLRFSSGRWPCSSLCVGGGKAWPSLLVFGSYLAFIA